VAPAIGRGAVDGEIGGQGFDRGEHVVGRRERFLRLPADQLMVGGSSVDDGHLEKIPGLTVVSL
jgi:hypothetical protein